jgi:Ca2+-transporting ATPase
MDFILKALEDLLLRILIACAFISLVIGIATEGLAHGWYEGTAILCAIIIVVAANVINEYKQDQQFINLFKKSDKKIIKVLRNSNLVEIDSQEILVGDLVEIHTGMIFPVDMILLSKQGKGDRACL